METAGSVSVADFLDTDKPSAEQATFAIQAAVNSGATCVRIGRRYQISAGIMLAENQVLDFDGGSLALAPHATFPHGVLYATAKSGIRIIGAVIDASVSDGGRGISLIDCGGAYVARFELIKCSLALEATSDLKQIGYKISSGIIDMRGWRATACYVSATNGVSLTDVETCGGLEGIGVYNNARNVKHLNCTGYRHAQDGFVIIAGQHIFYTACDAHDCGQSGFTTQRQTSGKDTKYVSYSNCQAYANGFDGFDVRGANSQPWKTDLVVNATGCIATGNSGTGFYVVNAEGSVFTGCVAAANKKQNFFIHSSDRVVLSGCESISGAAAIEAKENKAGILVYNSHSVIVGACTSTNSDGVTQNYGIAFTGSASQCQVIGGYYQNNAVAPYIAGKGNQFIAVPL